MNIVTTHDLPNWKVVSYGNGLSYDFQNKRTGESLFFQGGDASQFHEELESYSELYQEYALALAELWYLYS